MEVKRAESKEEKQAREVVTGEAARLEGTTPRS
jgi:hypothetical protein